MAKEVVIFDVETNGLKGSSALSISAIKLRIDNDLERWEKVGEYNRFYFRNPGEEVNYGAVNVNGLTDEVIREKRSPEIYPKYFLEDVDSFEDFCRGVEHFVAHNIKFDESFIPFKLRKKFDTMIENIDIVRVSWNDKTNSYKWPKLIECANYYKVPFDDVNFHESLYDVYITGRILYRMSRYHKTKERLKKFLT